MKIQPQACYKCAYLIVFQKAKSLQYCFIVFQREFKKELLTQLIAFQGSATLNLPDVWPTSNLRMCSPAKTSTAYMTMTNNW